MKKLLFLTATCAILTAPATAVQQCVALDASVNGTSYVNPGSKAEWSVTFPNVTVRGIGVCGSKSGSYKDLSDSFTTYDSAAGFANNRYCWCKMISQAVSSWVLAFAADDADYCAPGCNGDCASAVRNSSTFRSAMFGSISN